ncbi:hypothetical protein [Pseudomonas putida]|uniref:hypothetical protein n=1 Tax=Pseudomonas putida TaxID=303 RepID=UPI000ACA2FB5|nr:hypothetical protein [Pseudomonas putida]MCE0971495.1 hypothetical protein [Pseudomonas putida]MDD2116619.1 hypothetical protein [Pseudomonas putida]UPU93947.1 hypothetical protein M0766_06040 [Pseudomonas putida]HDS1731049.1 hypothetical protein [Pseudomonas putida]
MKLLKSLLSLSLILLLPNANADGGSGSNASATCSGVAACPAGQAGSVSFTYRIQFYDKGRCPGITDEVQNRFQQGQSNEDVMYYLHKATHYAGTQNINISRNCIDAGPTYQSTQTETQNLQCPATQPGGVWTQSRTYELWSDGSHRNPSAWADVIKTCVAAPVGRGTDTQSLNCPASAPKGIWTQTRTYDLWSDGTKTNFSPWVDSAKTCAAGIQSRETESRTVSCAIGEIGSIQQKQTYEIWTDGSKKNYSGWVVSSKNCKAVPTTTTQTREGVQEETCDSYNEVPAGTFSGTVYKYGTYITTYSETTKQTDTKFKLRSLDFTSCVYQFDEIITETQELQCPAGQSGSIQQYRIRVKTTSGALIYPDRLAPDGVNKISGKTWITSNNSCATTQKEIQNSNIETPPEGLLSNISVTSSSLQGGEVFSNYLNSLSASSWATNERHKLIVNIDDLSSGKYSASKIGAVVSKFQSVVGARNADIEIALPRTIDKYVGNGEITAQAVKEKTVLMKDVYFEGGDVRLTYMQLGKKTIEKPQSKEVVINVIPKNLGIRGVFSN